MIWTIPAIVMLFSGAAGTAHSVDSIPPYDPMTAKVEQTQGSPSQEVFDQDIRGIGDEPRSILQETERY